MEVFVVLVLVFIAAQIFECSRFLQKIYKLLIVQAGREKTLESLKYGDEE